MKWTVDRVAFKYTVSSLRWEYWHRSSFRRTAVKHLPLVLLLEYRMKESSVFIILLLYLFTDYHIKTLLLLIIICSLSCVGLFHSRVILNQPWWLFLPGRKGSAPPSVLAPKGDIGYFGMPGINGPPGKPGPLGKVFLLLTFSLLYLWLRCISWSFSMCYY